jgi:hypothetical protein
MAQGVITIPAQLALVREGLTGPTWSGARLGLITDSNPFNVTDTLASHTEASFGGYARQAVDWGPVFYDSGAANGPGPSVSALNVDQWSGPGDTSGQEVTGWILVQASESGSEGSAGSPLLLAAGPLDEVPFTLQNVYDLLQLVGELFAQLQANFITPS